MLLILFRFYSNFFIIKNNKKLMENTNSGGNKMVRYVLIAIVVLGFIAATIYVLNNMGDVEIAGDH